MCSDFLDGTHTLPPASEGKRFWCRPRITEAEISAHQEEYEALCAHIASLRASRAPKPNRQWDPLGCREFTLTYSKNWFDDETARDTMRLAMERLLRYYVGKFVQFRAVGEVGSGGQSHVHCFYELEGGKKITDKNFQRAFPKWDTSIKLGKTGHQGGHHASVKDAAGFKAYIEKDLDTTAWLNLSLDDIT